MIFILLFIFLLFFTQYLLTQSSNRFKKRERLPDHIHNKIQRAMNWSPDHFYKCDDGKYRNAKGEVGVHMTWEEIKKHKKEIKNG